MTFEETIENMYRL